MLQRIWPGMQLKPPPTLTPPHANKQLHKRLLLDHLTFPRG